MGGRGPLTRSPLTSRATNADRTLAGLVFALLITAPFVRPVWRAIDPRAETLLRAHLSIQARETVDPWGQPWVRTLWASGDPIDLYTVESAGPDMTVGTQDDIPLCVEGRREDGHFSIVGVGPWSHRSPTAWPVWSYRSSPAVPVFIAMILLLTRWVSGLVVPPSKLTERVIVAFALALPTTGSAVLLLGFSGAWRLIEAGPFVGVVSPAAAAMGSIYVMFTAAIFAHREFHHMQKTDDAGARAPTTDALR